VHIQSDTDVTNVLTFCDKIRFHFSKSLGDEKPNRKEVVVPKISEGDSV